METARKLEVVATSHNSSVTHADALIKARRARERRDAKSIADKYCGRAVYVPHRTEDPQ